MKTTTIALMAMLLLVLPLTGKKRYRYIDKNIPLFVSVRSLPYDIDDEISKGIKTELMANGFTLISRSEYETLQKRYMDDVKQSMTRMSSTDNFRSSSSADRFNQTYGKGTESQTIIIDYTFKDKNNPQLSNLDSIGFVYVKMPPKSAFDAFSKAMFPLNKVATGNIDSVVSFLHSKL